MRQTQQERTRIAWVLYLSILFASLMCAMGHGQAGSVPAGAHGADFCSMDMHGTTDSHTDTKHASLPMVADCAIASLFSSILLAALFCLLHLLSGSMVQTRSLPILSRSPREHWPLINPRASPGSLPAY